MKGAPGGMRAVPRTARLALGSVPLLSALLCTTAPVQAQMPASPGAQQTPAEPKGLSPTPEASLNVFPHPDAVWWVSGQANFIFQDHPAFDASYSGANSLRPGAEHATSRLITLFTGVQIGSRNELLLDLEEAGGAGLSGALGVAGFTNLDVVRNPTLTKAPYLGRLVFHHTVPLSDEAVEGTRGPLQTRTRLPARRLDLRLGKMGIVDFFDPNSVGTDSHLQFMNWTVDNNGAFDYAADTRGYTYALVAEYTDRLWSVRFGEALMPKVANGIELDWDVAKDRGENLEFEVRRGLLPGRDGAWRFLTYLNHAAMGSYRESIQAALAASSVPDITATRRKGRTKYGFGVNFEQSVAEAVRVFGRWGWSDGRNESFAYTEVDRTWSFGGDVRGAIWKRPEDKLGAAFVSNALSGDHREYLSLGGLGFLLGDGRLTYGREQIVEGYYTAHAWRGFFLGPALQYVKNPGYNRDRGPVWVFSFRFHADL